METDTHDNTREIQDTLLRIGIPSNLLGFVFLTKAIQDSINNPLMLHNVMRGLYADIAKEYHSSTSRVERAMRHAIEVAWTYGDLDYIESLFINSVNPFKGQPTNMQFISRMYFHFANEHKP